MHRWLGFPSWILLLVSIAPAQADEQRSPPAPQWIARAKQTSTPATYHARLSLPRGQTLDFADLFVAVDAQATVSINGKRVGEARGTERFAHFAAKSLLQAGENQVAVEVRPGEKGQALLLTLHVVDADGASHWLISDDEWQTADSVAADAKLQPVAVLGPVGAAPWGTPSTDVEHYHQWKQALGSDTAVDPRTIRLPPGYAIELLRSAGKDEGSWISLAFDDRGRLVIGREDRGLLRLTLPDMPKRKLAGDAAAKTMRVESINDTLLECRGLLFVGRDLYANANNSKGLYRLRDSNDDDQFDEVTLLREMPGDVGHGRNDLTLGPDGKLYLILGNDVRYPSDASHLSPFRNFAQDRLLPCEWNKFLFNSGTPAPGGYVMRTDLEGKTWEVIAGGFRNAYGIAFNDDGEMFTYDADMEWDAGAPWYRPTRINHIVSGGDYGWRQGTDKWRAWYPDSLPSNVDVGLGSPTAVKFAPAEFMGTQQETLLALDWAFGRILRVDLQESGASYTGRTSDFISGRPLNVCDVEFGPDGAMYFVTGGRRTQSGIYRVVRTAAEQPQEDSSRKSSSRATRRTLESLHGGGGDSASAVATAWPHLGSDDPWLRHAARVAIEAQEVDAWQARTLEESDPATASTALLALARRAPANLQPKVLARLNELPWKESTVEHRIARLRAYQLSLLRRPPTDAESALLRERLEPLYPSTSVKVNDLLCELLVYLQSPTVVARTLPLIDAAATTEEKLHYLMSLRLVKTPWTLDERRQYFDWLQRAQGFPGAHYMPRFIAFIREDAVAALSEQERQFLGKLIEPATVVESATAAPLRPFVKAWSLEDFGTDIDRPRAPVSAERGRALFEVAQCAKCHRFHGQGALVGPDLTGVGKRFNRRDLLISTLEPSRVIDDKYKQKHIVTTQGVTYIGQQVAADAMSVSLITDPTQPTKITRLLNSDIEDARHSLLSPMPQSLLNTLTKEEVLLLLDYLSSGE